MPSVTRLVTIDQKQMDDLLGTFDGMGKNWNKAMQAAISRTMTTGRALIARRIGETVNLKIADIKKQITMKRPTYRNLVGTITTSRKPVPLQRYMSAGQIASGMTLRSKVKGKQTRFRRFRRGGGLSFKVRKGGPVERAPFAFIAASTKNAFIGVFQRTRNKSGPSPEARQQALSQIKGLRGGKFKVSKRAEKKILYGGMLVPRMPIRLRMGPTAVGVLDGAPGKGAATIIDEVVNAIGPDLKKNVLSQIDRLLLNEKSFETQPVTP